jgi:hypothetical protein
MRKQAGYALPVSEFATAALLCGRAAFLFPDKKTIPAFGCFQRKEFSTLPAYYDWNDLQEIFRQPLQAFCKEGDAQSCAYQ